MSVPWWALVPLAVLVVAVAIACLRDGRERMRRLLDETRDDSDGGSS